ncbi:MAG: deoxynucleotide monophosphate kinase family protein [Acidithiobacillus sp.]
MADILFAEHGFQRIAFADCLYEEVSAAFNVPIEFLKNRDTREKPSARLSLGHCMDGEFAKVARLVNHRGNRPIGHSIIPYSPRQILQWWGTDYRRAQRETYWIDKVRDRLLSDLGQDWVVTDVRFQNEANLVRELGGQLGLVIRPGVEPVANHVSEEFWQTCSPDIVIKNDGTLEVLQSAVNVIVIAMAGSLVCGNTKNGVA